MVCVFYYIIFYFILWYYDTSSMNKQYMKWTIVMLTIQHPEHFIEIIWPASCLQYSRCRRIFTKTILFFFFCLFFQEQEAYYINKIVCEWQSNEYIHKENIYCIFKTLPSGKRNPSILIRIYTILTNKIKEYICVYINYKKFAVYASVVLITSDCEQVISFQSDKEILHATK